MTAVVEIFPFNITREVSDIAYLHLQDDSDVVALAAGEQGFAPAHRAVMNLGKDTEQLDDSLIPHCGGVATTTGERNLRPCEFGNACEKAISATQAYLSSHPDISGKTITF